MEHPILNEPREIAMICNKNDIPCVVVIVVDNIAQIPKSKVLRALTYGKYDHGDITCFREEDIIMLCRTDVAYVYGVDDMLYAHYKGKDVFLRYDTNKRADFEKILEVAKSKKKYLDKI